jgi:hypothetical protein
VTGNVGAGGTALRAWLRVPRVQLFGLFILAFVLLAWLVVLTYWAFVAAASDALTVRLAVAWGIGCIGLVVLVRAAWHIGRGPRV